MENSNLKEIGRWPRVQNFTQRVDVAKIHVELKQRLEFFFCGKFIFV